jgi:hypothetical protein
MESRAKRLGATKSQSSLLVLFLRQLGKDTNQGAVGFVIDREYYEILF